MQLRISVGGYDLYYHKDDKKYYMKTIIKMVDESAKIYIKIIKNISITRNNLIF